jgi:hypothetical protein
LLVLDLLLFEKTGAFVIDRSINILEFISLLVTIVIAFAVPFLIKKAIDDKRGIKSLLIKEIEDLIYIIEKNHKIISDLYSENEPITDSHRDRVREVFFDAELKIDSLKSHIGISYPSKISLSGGIFDHTIKYKEFLTDGKFMISSYKNIDYDFYREEKNQFSTFQKKVTECIHEIHKF